jgi:hypothetical protein
MTNFSDENCNSQRIYPKPRIDSDLSPRAPVYVQLIPLKSLPTSHSKNMQNNMPLTPISNHMTNRMMNTSQKPPLYPKHTNDSDLSPKAPVYGRPLSTYYSKDLTPITNNLPPQNMPYYIYPNPLPYIYDYVHPPNEGIYQQKQLPYMYEHIPPSYEVIYQQNYNHLIKTDWIKELLSYHHCIWSHLINFNNEYTKDLFDGFVRKTYFEKL